MISENFNTETKSTVRHGDLILTVGGSQSGSADGSQSGSDGSSLTLDYVIQDPVGIHARPAGELLKLAKKFKSEIFFSASGKTVKLNSIFSLMSLGVKKGTTVHIEAQGEDGAAAIQAFQTYLQAHL